MTANEWDLYSDKEGADEAAATINEAVTKEVRKVLAADPKLDKRKLAAQARDNVYKVMDGIIGFGARDTEPETVLVIELEDALGVEVDR
jgi:hypothetical protein